MATPVRRSGGRLTPVALALLVVALLLSSTGGAVAGALITGAQIKNGTVTGADIKNRSLTGVDVKDGTVTAADTRDEARVFAASSGNGNSDYINDFTSGSFVPIISKSFTSRAGYVAISAHVYAEADATLGSDGNLFYAVRLDGHLVGSHSRIDTSTTVFEGDGWVTVTLPVSSGVHTLELVARETANGSFIRERSIMAVWTPTGSVSGTGLVSRPVARAAGNG